MRIKKRFQSDLMNDFLDLIDTFVFDFAFLFEIYMVLFLNLYVFNFRGIENWIDIVKRGG